MAALAVVTPKVTLDAVVRIINVEANEPWVDLPDSVAVAKAKQRIQETTPKSTARWEVKGVYRMGSGKVSIHFHLVSPKGAQHDKR